MTRALLLLLSVFFYFFSTKTDCDARSATSRTTSLHSPLASLITDFTADFTASSGKNVAAHCRADRAVDFTAEIYYWLCHGRWGVHFTRWTTTGDLKGGRAAQILDFVNRYLKSLLPIL